MKGKGKMLTYWLLREETEEEEIEEEEPVKEEFRDILEVEKCSSLIENLGGYEMVDESVEMVSEEARKEPDLIDESTGQVHDRESAEEEFLHKSDMIGSVTTVKNTGQMERSEEGGSAGDSDSTCSDMRSCGLGETRMEEECTNL